MPTSFGARLPVRFVAAIALLLGWFALTTVTAPAASAHAVVTASTPGDQEKVSKAPSEVTIQFSEGITSELGGLKVLSSRGEQVDNGDSSQPTATSVRVSLKPDLKDGTYLANYKVVSADGHPISGAIVFGIGNATIGDVSSLAASNDRTLDVLSKVGQFVMYLGALMAAGLAFFLGFVHDGAADRRPLGRVTRGATIVAAAGIVLVLLAQAGLATGGGIGAAFDLATLRGVLKQGLGWQCATMLVGLAMCHLSVDAKRPVVGQSLAFYGGIAVTGSFVLWGHATEAAQPWLSIPADVAHVAVAAVWFGGLTGLVVVLRTRIRAAGTQGDPHPHLAIVGASGEPDRGGDGADDAVLPTRGGAGGATATAVLDRPTDRAADPNAAADVEDLLPPPGSYESTVLVVNRFSTTAAIAVAALVVAGVALGYTEVGSISSLTSTTYGQLLLVKTAGVSIILFLAMYNRFFLLPWLLPEGGRAALLDAPVDPAPDVADPTPVVADASGDPGATGDEAGTDADADADVPVTAAEIAEREALAERAGWHTLLTTVKVEALIIVAVLALTAVLVNTTPARTTVIPAGPFQQAQPYKDGSVSMIITPNSPGANNIHLDFLGPDGKTNDPAQKVTLELRLPSKDLGPLTRDMIKGGTGHFLLEKVPDLSIAGDWEITVIIRVSDFNQERVTFTDTIS